jgi:hypothetical protein
MKKRDIINFFFLISLPIYGIGTYVSAAKSPSTGYLVSILPSACIIVFYLIDLIYKRSFNVKVNFTYWLMVIYTLSTCISLFRALNNGLPEATFSLTLTKSLLLLAPFQSFVIVALYNHGNEDALPRLTLISMSVLLIFNMVGFFGLGLTNEVHSIEGRLNFPFLDGFYSGASLLAITNIVLLRYLKVGEAWSNPLKFYPMVLFFVFNLFLFLGINSRLCTLILFLIFILMLFKVIRVKGLFAFTMWTIPILLTSGMLLYAIMKMPGMDSIFVRVDVEDVTTFNGRSYIWEDGMHWLEHDQEGLWFGNGYKGHYFLHLIDDVAERWNVKDVHHLHMHSTSMEILICQGVIMYALFCWLLYRVYMFYKRKHAAGEKLGYFFPAIVFLLFILQVDTFVYDDSLGFVLLTLMVSSVAVAQREKVADVGKKTPVSPGPTLADPELIPAAT